MGKYELLYIVHPDLESSIDKIIGRVHGFIEDKGGKITYEENWGKRKLAYQIKKSEVGIYILTYFEAPKEALAKVERDLRLTEEVIRFMVLAKEEKIKSEAKEKSQKKETPQKAESKVKKAEKPEAKEKEEPAKEESETERMKKLDEKLGEILGEEEDNKKEDTKKAAKPKAKKE